MTLTRGFIRNAVTTPLDARLMDMAKVVCNADGSPRVGVLGGANASIVSTTATMNVAIAAAEFVASKGKADGASIFTNDGTVNVAIGAAPVSNSRIDVIYVKHNDDTTGDANALPVFGVLAGTAAASPTKPGPLPTGAVELATIRIYSGTTATNGGSNLLTNTYQMTAMRGGLVPVRNLTERDAWTNRPDGAIVHVLDIDSIFIYADSTIGWLQIGGKPVLGAITFSGIYSAGSPAPRVIEAAGRISLDGIVVSTSANFSGGTYYQIGTIPVDRAPASTIQYAVNLNGVFGGVAISSAGAVSFFSSVTFTGVLNLYLPGASWPDRRLG